MTLNSERSQFDSQGIVGWDPQSFRGAPRQFRDKEYLALEGLANDKQAEAMANWSFVRTWHSFGTYSVLGESDISPVERLRRFLQAQGIDTKRTTDSQLQQFSRDERYRPVFLRLGQQTIRVPNFQKKVDHKRQVTDTQAPAAVPESRAFRLVQRKRCEIVRRFADAPREMLSNMAQVALRSEFECEAWVSKGAGVFAAGDLQVNVQTGEVQWREDGLRPLPDSMTRFEDFETIFGDASLQCGVVSRTKHRLWVHVVGQDFDIVEWDASPQSAWKQGISPVGKADDTRVASEYCRICGQMGKCWSCESCTMINCNSNADECSVCGQQRKKTQDSDDEAVGLQHQMFMYGRRQKKKLKPVTECFFRGKPYSRILDVYAEEPPQVPATEQWALTSSTSDYPAFVGA